MEIIDADDAEDSVDKSIRALKFIEKDENSLTMHIDFTDSSAISSDLLEPDRLQLTFCKPALFVA